MAFWLQKPAKLLPPDQCNPGRATPNPQAAGPDALHYTKQTRLCEPFPEGLEVAIFGFGCFWCSEGALSDLDGIYSTSVGYAGGATENPTHRDACGGDTNHNEVVRVVFDPTKLPYAELLRYRSGVYYFSEDQRLAAEASKVAYAGALVLAGRSKGPVSTEILPAPKYWIAEVAHQQYDAKPGSRDYCGLSPLGVACPPAQDWPKAAAPAPAPAAAATA
ncbi:peptide-methionine (S)-S-oxide reductase [Aureococcus anophagefferens]|nr:peptide-methionine (S)-S-oxide reductase [Aureococcus anophagefferens]